MLSTVFDKTTAKTGRDRLDASGARGYGFGRVPGVDSNKPQGSYDGCRVTAEYNSGGDVTVTDFIAAMVAHGQRLSSVVAVIGLLAIGLAGCETAGSLFGGGPSTSNETAPSVAAKPSPLAKVAFSPVIGPPDGLGKQMVSNFSEFGDRNRFTVIPDSRQADYTLRGYVVASREKAGTKVSYIWDVADNTGKRVNRISGEVMAPGQPNAKEPWVNVTPELSRSIAESTSSTLGTWLPAQSATPVAAKPATPSSTPVAGAGAGTVAPPAAPVAVVPASTNTTTAALPRNDDVAAVVPLVTGAPGDGNATLASALQRELSRQGIALVDKPGSSYRVEGKVVMGQTADGKQPIQIDWRVKDPQGKSLGTVSQKNEIPPGSLDGPWGKVADAAAAAAAQGIIKLLPQVKSTN